jgi:hypothetical protein
MFHLRVTVAVLCLLTISSGCSQNAPPKEPGPTPGPAAASCMPGVRQVDLSCPAPPSTFSTAGLQFTQLGQAWDAWAWSSFAAMNWPALAAPGNNAFPTGFVRGVPDVNKAFTRAQSRDVSVWETFKEKRELFNDTATPQAWQSLTFDPKYAPVTHGGQIAMCAGAEDRVAAALKAGPLPRVFARLSKVGNSEDETAEVASPPQESTDALCNGYSGNFLSECQSFFQPPPGGTRATPYTATDTNGRNFPVGPRVFKGKPSTAGFVYYEVKVNYDYYAYVTQPITVSGHQTSLNVYASAVAQAKANGIVLPYRTSATSKFVHSGNTDAVVNYSAPATAACYAKNGLLDCNLPGQPTVSVADLPALGSIQLKAAWVPAALLDGDPNTYHLTDAVYYKDSPSQKNGLCFDVQTFGLVGLHIIQRVHAAAPGGAPEPPGGTYIFATWEHRSVKDGAAYSYVNYSKFADNTERPYPNTADGLQVARLQNYPLPTTNNLNAAVQSQLAGSVWANYRLIGTQFQALDLGSSAGSAQHAEALSLQVGQPIYLANLLIETNRGLQQFQGQPPGDVPNSNFGTPNGNGVPRTYQFFSPTTPNTSFNGKALNMGGCMGCHGVAQTQGFSFSFVLLDGDKGTVPDTATSISIPPVALPPS